MGDSQADINERQMSFKQKPPGVILDAEEWLYLKERYYMTNREMQVGILACRGFSNDEIADSLRIKRGTVKTHLRNLYRRVHVKNKVLLLLRLLDDIKRYYTPPKRETPSVPIVEIPPETQNANKHTKKD